MKRMKLVFVLSCCIFVTGLVHTSHAALLIDPAVGANGDIEGNGTLNPTVGDLPTDGTWNRVGAAGPDAKAFTENRAGDFSNQVGTKTLAINSGGSGIWNNTGVDITTFNVDDKLALSLLVGLRNSSFAPAIALYEIGVIDGGVFTSLVSGTFEDTDSSDGVLDLAPAIYYTIDGTETGSITVHITHNNNQVNSGRVYVDGVALVPEPATLSLLATGFVGIFLRRKR